MTSKPVLISGAGLGGLLLARSLRTNNIPFLLYERDASLAARAQGYRIRVSTDGLNALKEVMTEKDFVTFAAGASTTGGGGIHNYDAISGEETPSPGAPKDSSGSGPGSRGLGGDVLGVGRGWLRQCLFNGMEDSVHWNRRSTGFSTQADGVTLKFADGTSSPEGSLLIAADGPHSAIAKQLTDGKVRAFDTGARMIHGQTPARAFQQLGYGVCFATDNSAGESSNPLSLVTTMRPEIDIESDVEVGWVFAGGPGTFDAPNNDFSTVGKVAADMSRELTAKWHAKFRPIFEQQNDAEAAFLKMSTADPAGVPEWTNAPCVTLMGDAVHCMTPAGGVGANTALRDAALLGRLIAKAGGWQDGLTAVYEKEMRVYASENVRMSFEEAAKRFNIKELK